MPPRSEALAELIGILLGDGTIARYQVRISLDATRDREYAIFVSDLAELVIGERPSYATNQGHNLISLTFSGIGLVEMLEGIGMKKGDKIKNQVSFPEWIVRDFGYKVACMRGLFDTDGGLYFHKKKSGTYLGWCFASFSRPLREQVFATLQEMGFNVKKSGEHRLFMYRFDDIERYFKFVGSHNPKNIAKLALQRR